MQHCILFIIVLLACGRGMPQAAPEGAGGLFNPLTVMVNNAFDITQLDNHSRAVFKIAYGKGFRNVWRNLKDPFPVLRRYGWREFVSNEVLPIALTRKQAQWWPNYQLHLIGGGYVNRQLQEWYRGTGFAYPKTAAAVTTMAYHLLNEAVENGEYEGDNADPIADIYLFDLGGILLFESDAVYHFFRDGLRMREWGMQPGITVPGGDLHNNGEHFSVLVPMPWTEQWHIFYYFGMNGLTGLSYTAGGATISAGAGLRAKNTEQVKAEGRQNTITLVWNGGVFYDRGGQLLASLLVSGLTQYTVQANAYPGLFSVWGVQPGVWLAAGRNGRFHAGVSLYGFPGAGVSF